MRALAAAGVVLALVPACSDAGPAAGTTTTVAAATTASTSTSTSSTVAPTTVPPTAPPLTPEELTAEVAATFQLVFSPGTQDATLVENADAHAATLDELRARPNADTVVALVSATALTNAECLTAGVTAPCALAVWTLTYKGHELLSEAIGHAVYDDGVWKVADRTWCTIVQQSVPTPAGC